MKWMLIILLLVLFGSDSFAQRTVQTDTAARTARLFDSAAIKQYDRASEFQYDRVVEPTPSLWDRFWLWFWWKVAQIMSTKGGRTTVWTTLSIVGLAVLAFFIYKVSTMNRGGSFVRSGKGGLDFTVGHEDIHQIAFDEEIKAAVDSGKYRLAVRLLYLQSLKKLSDNNYIDWRINKTNIDYVREVAQKPWQSLFGKLTYQFEYVWYGETDIARERFDDLQQEFKQLHNLL